MHAHSSIYKKYIKDFEDKHNITKRIKVLQSHFVPCISNMHLDNELVVLCINHFTKDNIEIHLVLAFFSN